MTACFVQAAAARENTEGVGRGDVEAGIAIEEAQSENVATEKAPGRPKEGTCHRESCPTGLLLQDKKFGKGIYLADLAREIGKGIVMQVAVEPEDRSVAFQFLVYEGIPAPAGLTPVYESQ